MDRDEIRQMYHQPTARRSESSGKKSSFFSVLSSQFILCASVVLLAFLVKNFTPQAVPTIAGTVDQVMAEDTGFEALGKDLNDKLRSLPVFGGQVKSADPAPESNPEPEPETAPEHNPYTAAGEVPIDQPPAIETPENPDEVINIKDAKIIPEDSSGISLIGSTSTGATQVVSMSYTRENYFLKYGDLFLSDTTTGEDALTARVLAEREAEAAREAAAKAHAVEQETLRAAAKERKLTAEELARLDYPEKALFDRVDLGMTLTTPVHGWITDDFGWRNHPTAGDVRFHYGQDIAAAKGTEIHCAFSGIVEEVGQNRAYGNYLYVRYNENLVVFYGHCDSVIVAKGDRVSEGQTVALVGSTGISTGNHVHVELKYQGKNLNPNFYFNPQG